MRGQNNLGQLGNIINSGTTDPTPTPTLVSIPDLNDRKITQVALAFNHSAALLEDGSLYMWGYNYFGTLGNDINNNIPNIPNPAPTLMFKLGVVSQITANSTITAKEAVDKLWIDGSFNLSGFKDSFNLYGIPDAADQTFNMTAKPTYDNQAGTVTMKIGIKYFYDENGLLVSNTAATAMTISDFASSLTSIFVKTNPKNDIVVDK